MSRRIIGPFSRVEGHLEIDLERSEDKVVSARVNSPMYRGMETVMLNRTPMDALTIAPRICGICSVSQSVAAARVLANLANIQVPQNGQLITNLILACEVLSNHMTHFYMFFMPDFARTIYKDQPWYNDALKFKAQTGTAQAQALEARSQLLQIMGVLAGKWPHTLTIRPGGTTQSVMNVEKLKLKTILSTFRRFLEQSVFGIPLEQVLSLTFEADVQGWASEAKGDAVSFLKFSKSLNLDAIGKTSSALLSGGGYPTEAPPLFKQGLCQSGKVSPLPVDNIREDISHSFMGGPMVQPPYEGQNDPFLDKESAYSWCKAPRLDGARCEVGALARQVINGEALFCNLYQIHKSTVETRVFARLWEMAKLVTAMEGWIQELDPDGAFYEPCEFPDSGQAVAFVEAARGTLGHWITVENGLISNYQIVAPTTWNFSPRDHMEQTGPLEDALESAPIQAGEEDPVSVQHIVRSFDPCMACTVH